MKLTRFAALPLAALLTLPTSADIPRTKDG